MRRFAPILLAAAASCRAAPSAPPAPSGDAAPAPYVAPRPPPGFREMARQAPLPLDGGLVMSDAGIVLSPLPRTPPRGPQPQPPRMAARSVRPSPPDVLDCVAQAEALERSTGQGAGAELKNCLASLTLPKPTFAGDAGVRFAATFASRPVNPACAVPEWDINASTGNDNNTCTSSAHPCKTLPEVMARDGGNECVLSGVQVIWFHADHPITEYMDWRPVLAEGGDARIIGDLVSVATPTISAVTTKTRAANTVPLIGTLSGTVSTYLGDLLVNATHPSLSWVSRNASSVATMSEPFVSNVPAAPAVWSIQPNEVDTSASADTVTVQRPVKLYLANFAPVVATDFNTSNGAAIGHVWVPTANFAGGNYCHIGKSVTISESRIDPVLYAESDWFTNSDVALPGHMARSMFNGGVLGSDGSVSLVDGEYLDGDVTLKGIVFFQHEIEELTDTPFGVWGNVFVDGADAVLTNGPHLMYEPISPYGFPSTIYGDSTAGTARTDASHMGKAYFNPPVATNFHGVTACLSGQCSVATTLDLAHSPLQTYPDIGLSFAQIGTAISSGGLGGIALGAALDDGYVDNTLVTTPPTPSNLCSGGQFMTGDPAVPCATPGGGVSSVTGTSGVLCSPTTGAVSCSNTGVTSAVAGTGISVSGATGAVTITNAGVTSIAATSPVAVSGSTGAVTVSLTTVPATLGGTGVASPTANGVAVANGASAFTFPTSSVGGQPFVAAASGPPGFGAIDLSNSGNYSGCLGVSGCGTGVSNCPSGDTVWGNGVGALQCVPTSTTFSGTHATALTALSTFFTLASVTKTTSATETFTMLASVNCVDSGDANITYGIGINSNTSTSWAHVVTTTGILAHAGNATVGAAVDFSTTIAAGTNTIYLIAENPSSTTSTCDGDLVVVLSAN